MGILDLFCFCCCGREEEPEKSPLISETLLYFDREVKRKRAEEANLWNEPLDPSHTERDDDRELYNLLHRRAKTRRGSEGYRRLSFDIGALRQVRKDVKGRWRMILENLGFSNEADALLTVTSNTSYKNLKNPSEALRLLTALSQETSIFEQHCSPPERYLFVLDRLVLLDVGAHFVSMAKQYYPLGSEEPSERDPEEPTAVLVTQSPEGTKAGEGVQDSSLEVDEDSFMVNQME
ncbi:melanoregulin-like [Ambystoma mexicanum]|uniref:melanoregulin-like n=1 Tax=Ambystoma mexicanum TaxID=8296 RepID=UPI0037E73366